MAKSALTELIEFIDRQEEPLSKVGLTWVIRQIYLEKEKQQIIDVRKASYRDGYSDGSTSNTPASKPEQYYKENFE